MGKKRSVNRILFFILFSGAFGIQNTVGIGDTHLCSTPLGMESKRIPDSALRVSSYYVQSVGPHQARLNTEGNGGAWCPKEPISYGVREWLEVSLNGTHLVSGVQIQGRFARGKGQEYTEEFEIEYFRDGFTHWRKYYKFDGKTVLQGNSDTFSVVTNKLRPPLIAQKIRILPYSTHRRTVCLRLELLGCLWEDGVVEYKMRQGDNFSEGISLRDESYDGIGSKWDRSITNNEPHNTFTNINNINLHELDENNDEKTSENSEKSGEKSEVLENSYLTSGLGELTDKIEGAHSFAMDIGFGLGNGWVGWRRKKPDDDEEFVEIIFEFDRVRTFSFMDIYVNNYPSKGVLIFSSVRVHFSIGGIFYNGKGVKHAASPDLTLEHARNLSFSLSNSVGKYVKVQLSYRSHWILLSEIYFNSEIYDGNFTEEDGGDVQMDFTESQSPLEIRDLDSSMVETVIGIISGLILLISFIAGFLVWMRRSGRHFPTSLHFHPSNSFPFFRHRPWGSVPTHIVASSNTNSEGVKDLLLTLTPQSNGISNGVSATNGPTSQILTNNGDFKSYNPPIYTNGSYTTKKINNSNALLLKGAHQNNYGSLTKKNLDENGSRTTSLTLRSNQLASLDENYFDDEIDEENLSNDYQDISTQFQTVSNKHRTKNKKYKVAGSVWNLGSGRAFRVTSTKLVPQVSLRQLRLIENLGSCLYGQVHLYEFEGEIACHEGTLYRNCRLIAKTIKSDSEVRLLSILDHEHVSELIGLCSEMKSPKIGLYAAPACGDLCSFLSRLTNTPSLSWLLNVGSQIASGMNYLESLSLIHRDLAARNCLVEREGSIRISDLAMACEQYIGDYSETPSGLAPLRWWSWESVLSDEFSMKSSVWSFGVTLWEILTLCRQKPLSHVPDHQLHSLAQKYGSTATNQVWLPQPVLSPPEIYDLMRECWQRNADERPTFQHIHLFLEQKCNNTIYHVV